MISLFLKAYWKQLVIVAMLAALVIGGVVAWNVHGDRQYAAGYAQAQAVQKQADDQARAQRDQEKTQIEREAQSRIDVARVDAEHANTAADGLRAELDKTKRIAEHYTGSFPTGTPASKVIGVLADMLEESNRSYIATAEEAERYRDAGITCERQYDTLTKRGTNSR
ncbi:endopeptidase [Enterobacter cloacae]|nr:endopeptidase [Enterobacter cloacae]